MMDFAYARSMEGSGLACFEISFGKLVLLTPVQFQRPVGSMPRYIKALLMACSGPTPYHDML